MIEHVYPKDRDASLELRVRADNCPSMGILPEEVYDEIENNTLRGRGDFDTVVHYEVFETIGPIKSDIYEYREKHVRVVHGRYANGDKECTKPGKMDV